MVDHELARPDRQILDAVARLAGVDRVVVIDETLVGESRSTFAVAAGHDELVVKIVPGAQRAMDNQRRLVRLVCDLRRRGYPAPEYVGAGESAGTIFTIQRRLPGQTLHRGPGMPPAPELFAAVLPSLLAAVELQRDAGDLAQPPWPGWLLDTIEAGGDGYCLHATMHQATRTAALLRRLQALARRNRRDEAQARDVVHFDMNPANILHADGCLSGVVDWNIPFDGAGQGDRGFDIATLLFYTYDIERTREALWERALAISGLAWTTVYLCHLSLRQVEWSRRHSPGAPTKHVSWPSPKPCCTTARREARDETGPNAAQRNWCPASCRCALPADRPVGELTDQVGVPVVAGVLLDHVDVDPPQGAGFTCPGEAGVAEAAGIGRLPARLAFGLPSRQVGFPFGAVQGNHLAVFDGGVVPDAGRAGLPLQDPPEPGALDLGHVPDQAMQGEPGGCHGARLPRVIVSALALQQQRRPVELQPCLQHLPLIKPVFGRFGPPRVLKVFHHEPEPTGRRSAWIRPG
jgi:aminoglycoside phosphotransferase (APT) family kinase protein